MPICLHTIKGNKFGNHVLSHGVRLPSGTAPVEKDLLAGPNIPAPNSGMHGFGSNTAKGLPSLNTQDTASATRDAFPEFRPHVGKVPKRPSYDFSVRGEGSCGTGPGPSQEGKAREPETFAQAAAALPLRSTLPEP